MSKFVTNFGGRRFLLTVGCGITCTVLLILQFINPEIFRDLIIATVAVYIGANTAQKFSDNKTEVAKYEASNVEEG